MKRYLFFLLILIFFIGCSNASKNKEILAKVNNYEITEDEFEEEFRESTFSRTDTPESRKEFLNSLIDRKLILQDAQKKGLGKEESFLKMIEKFWEQSLLKLALDRRSKEIANSAAVTDKLIEDTYNKMVKEGKVTKPYNQAYSQIKWELTKVKESQMMNDWVEELRKKAQIKVNDELLKSK